jgi:hypothetical protein
MMLGAKRVLFLQLALYNAHHYHQRLHFLSVIQPVLCAVLFRNYCEHAQPQWPDVQSTARCA